MSTSALPEESTPVLSQGERVLYTFIEPSKTMADLRRNTSWWLPWLLISIFSIGFSYTVDKRIGWGQVVETQIQANPKGAERMEKMPEEQRDKIMKMQVTIAKAISYAAPVTMLLFFVVVAGVLLGIFNFGFGAKLRFDQTMAISAYSFLPSLISTCLIILVIFFIAPDSFDVRSPLATNPGYFVPSTSPFLKGILSAFDVFTLWQLFLTSLGVSRLSKVKTGTAFATLFGLVFLIKLLGAAASLI